MNFARGSLILVLLFLVSFNLVFAEDQNITQQQKAQNCLNSSLEVISFLNESGFSTVRLGDIYQEAYSLYFAQVSLEVKQKGKGDYTVVTKRCEEILNLRDLALTSFDSFESLKKFYNDTLSSQIDTSSVDITITEIESEIRNERYEKVPPLVDKAYEQISTLRAENTQLTLFFKTTTSGLKEFLYEHRIILIVSLVILIVLFMVYRVTIKKWLLQQKINKLELRKNSLHELIKKTQLGYFQKGNVSESDYNIRVKNFAELVRDIDRQLPLLREEYLKLSRKIAK